jgi:endoplasmic reticulum chaperone BiP
LKPVLITGLENYAVTLKNQVSDEEQLGGKLDAADKKKLLDACKETIAWIDEHGISASQEDFDEQKEKLSQIAYPITSKLYKDQSTGGDDPLAHDEL